MTTKPTAEQTVMSVLADRTDATTVTIAAAGKLGRSTVSKALARLESAGKVRRSVGGREGARRQPDAWALASRRKSSPRGKPTTPERLRPGQLDGIVLEHLRKHADYGPLGPAAIAKGLSRSSGAVANCLERLVAAGRVRQTRTSPRRYSLTVPARRTRPPSKTG